MIKYFCDICGKELAKDELEINIRDHGSIRALLVGHKICSACGKPILTFLKKHKLLDQQSK